DAVDIADRDMLARQAHADQQVEAGERRRSGPAGRQPDLRDVLADDAKRIVNGRGDTDGGAVLIVMENRDIHPLTAEFLYDKAFGRLDIFQIDAAEGWLHRRDDIHQLFRVALIELDIEDINAGELLEEDRLPFHHRLGGERPDGAKAEHGRAV